MARGIEQIPWCYDGCMAVFDALGLARLRRSLVDEAQGRILEVGCGTGRNLPLYPPKSNVVALDHDGAVLRRARQRAPGTACVVARAEALPFADASFDTVVSGLVFCSVADPARALAEIRRVLRPDGRLCMLEHVRHASPRWAALQDWITPLWVRLSGGCHPNRDTESAVVRAGFDIDQQSRASRSVLRRFSARPGGRTASRR